MEAHFEDKLVELNDKILRMSVMVEEAIAAAGRCFENMDVEEAHRIIVEDNRINRAEQDIDDFVTEFIALAQPVAGDLRGIITSLQVSTELERMGDHAAHVAKAVIRLSEIPGPTPTFKIPNMAGAAVQILRDATKSFLEGDTGLAHKTAQFDEKIDKYHDKTLRQAHKELVAEPEEVDKLINLLFVSRFMERFGDHAKNICELAVYRAIGERVAL